MFSLAVAVRVFAASAPAIPFAFVENRGQVDSSVRYIGSGPGSREFFRESGVAIQNAGGRVSYSFEGASAHPRIESKDELGAMANFLVGSDPRSWRTDVPMSRSLLYRDVWPGVDIVYRADADPEYVIAEGGSIGSVRLRFDAETVVQSDGSLAVSGKSGRLGGLTARVIKETNGIRRSVRARFVVHPDGTVGLVAASTAAPAPAFSGFVGGPSEITITAVAVNSSYNIVVAGWALGNDLSGLGGVQSYSGGGVDAFVAAFSPTGGSLLYCTYLGGSGDDRAFGLTVDSSNNTYVTGWTSSFNFPVLGGIQAKLSGARDAFVAKLNASGSSLIFSTYLGGTGMESGNAIALDSTGSPVIVGDTTSTNLKVSAGAFQSKLSGSQQDVFVAKLSPSGNSIIAQTYLGGSGVEHGTAVIVDSANEVIVGGSTCSNNFPVLNAAQPHSGGGQDGFVTKLAANLTQLVFSTYYGGSGGTPGAPEQVNGLALKSSGNIVAAGITSSLNFPVTPGVLQSRFGGGNTDGFVGRFAPTGAMQFSTYLGGSSDDGVNAVALDFYGYIYLAGYTASADFPTQNPMQAPGGGMDAFVLKLNGNQLEYSTFLGGGGNDSAAALAVDSMSSVVVAGTTSSPDFPAMGAMEAWPGGQILGFVTKIAPNFKLALAAAPVFLFDIWHDTGYNGSLVNLNVGSFGQPGDIPIVGDWTGSGKKSIGVFRSGVWLLDTNGDGMFDAGDQTVVFGQSGDLPVVGDWNGTGTIKLGLFRQGSFILDLSGHLSGIPTGLADQTFSFGLPGDIPVAMDWNGSGTTKVGVFRNGSWLVDYNGDRVFNSLDRTYSFGQAGDIPVIGDWTSTGTPEIGVYRNGLWILDYGNSCNMNNPNSLLRLTFGSALYSPLVM